LTDALLIGGNNASAPFSVWNNGDLTAAGGTFTGDLAVQGGDLNLGPSGNQGILSYNTTYGTTDNYLSLDANGDSTADLTITDTGYVGIGTTNPTTPLEVIGDTIISEQVGINGTTINNNYALNIGNLSANQRGINIYSQDNTAVVQGLHITVDSPNTTGASYGIYAEQINTISSNDFVGLYTNVDGGKSQGVYNQLTAGASGYAYGVRNATLTDNDATFASLYGMASNIIAEGFNSIGYGVYNYLQTGNDVDLQKVYGAYNVLITYAGNSDEAYGNYIIDGGNTSTGGTQYGLYVDLDDPDVTNYSIYVESGSGNSYFGSNLGIGDASPASLLTVGNGDLFQVDSSGDIVQIGGAAHSIVDTYGELTLNSAGANIVLNDQVALGSSTTGLQVTTAGVLSDLDSSTLT
ncbi:MAG: hypothetical protein D6698_07140, partial [Gammaproteobacteria bacterium]